MDLASVQELCKLQGEGTCRNTCGGRDPWGLAKALDVYLFQGKRLWKAVGLEMGWTYMTSLYTVRAVSQLFLVFLPEFFF